VADLKEVEVMRFVMVACGVGALALAGMAYQAAPVEAAKSKMGCMLGKEKWDSGTGKCVPGKSKYFGQSPKKDEKK
jgi:hypothetical protein